MVTVATKIGTDMSDNANYLTPVPTLAELATATTTYNLAYIASKSGDTSAIEEKNQQRADLIALLKKLGKYVIFTAEGDRPKLATSGFPLSKIKEPTPPLGKPELPKVTNGINPGSLNYATKRMKPATAYQFEYTTTDPSLGEAVWLSQSCGRCKFTVTGLESGKRYWCRVGVSGPRNQQVYSDVVTIIVQ
jgi:hypothetical protein